MYFVEEGSRGCGRGEGDRVRKKINEGGGKEGRQGPGDGRLKEHNEGEPVGGEPRREGRGDEVCACCCLGRRRKN